MNNDQFIRLEKEFDLDFYIFMNNDVAIKFNFDYKNIKDHFFKVGYKEKRLYSKNQSNLFYFNNWIEYIVFNKDILKKKINNEVSAFKHYLEHGMKEKRKIYPKKINKYQIINIPIENNFEIIDIEFCRKMNANLNSYDENQIIKFIAENYKINNTLLFSLNHKNLFENYDWNQYLVDYPDLKINKIFNKIDALNHYLLFGYKEGRNIKTIENQEAKDNLKNEKENNNELNNSCLNVLNEIQNDNENLFDILKNNILDNANNLNIEKYNIKDINDIYKVYEILCLDFDFHYYYKLNCTNFKLENDENNCLEHFFNIGINQYLPYSKSHYLLLINYDWITYSKNNNELINKNNPNEGYLFYIKNKYYFNNHLDLPNIKYKIDEFINEFYNTLYNKNTSLIISYKYFLNDENPNKIFPNLYNYFLYSIINWEQFVIDNKLNMPINELINILIESDYDFKKYNIVFNNVIDLKLPNKDKLINLTEFKYFYFKIISFIKNNKTIKNIIEINKEFNKIFNKDLFDIPKKFEFINYKTPENIISCNLSFNIIISYIGKYEAFYNLLLSILYQNYLNYKILILNKCCDDKLIDKINNLKKSLNIVNEIFIIDKNEINENLEIFSNLKNEIKYIKFKNYIKNFDINILIDTNFYFKNNNILENICLNYMDNNYYFNKIIVENFCDKNKNLNSIVILNSDILINNLFLIFNYFNFEFKNHEIINDLSLKNNGYFVDHNFYNTDLILDYDYDYNYPIFILYENKDYLTKIHDIMNYTIIEVNSKEKFDSFISYINNNNIYDRILIFFIDKIIDEIETFNVYTDIDENYSLYNIHKKSKKKNIKITSRAVPKLYNLEAFICNYKIRECYLKSNKN